MFITFEGIDCSGKTTQAKLVVEHFTRAGREVLFLREPGGTPISEKVREILLDRSHPEMTQKAELFLFSAARTQLVAQVIIPALSAGKVVICDRFYDSTTAYQGHGRGLDLEEVGRVNRIAVGGTTPDLTLFIDIETEEIFRRQKDAGIRADRMESAGRAFFEAVRRGYHEIARQEPGRFAVVDGMRPVQEIHTDIMHIIASLGDRS